MKVACIASHLNPLMESCVDQSSTTNILSSPLHRLREKISRASSHGSIKRSTKGNTEEDSSESSSYQGSPRWSSPAEYYNFRKQADNYDMRKEDQEAAADGSYLHEEDARADHAYHDHEDGSATGLVSEIASIERHKDQVFAIAVAGRILYTASQGKDIRAFWAPEFREVDRFGSGNGVVQSLVADQGDLLYSAHQDHKIRVWRRRIQRHGLVVARHRLVAVLPMLAHRASNMVAGSYVPTRRHHRSLWIQHVDTISALALDRNRRPGSPHVGAASPRPLLYSASWDRTVKVWTRPAGVAAGRHITSPGVLRNSFKCAESFRAHDDAVNAIAVISDGRPGDADGSATLAVATASADSTVKLWRRARRKHTLLCTLCGHRAAVNALAVSADHAVIYSGSSDCTVVAWEREKVPEVRQDHVPSAGLTVSFKLCSSLVGHSRAVLSISAVGLDVVCSGSADATVRVWKRRASPLTSYECLAVLDGHTEPVKAIASVHASDVAIDDQVNTDFGDLGCILIYSGGLDSKVKVWEIETRSRFKD